MLMEQTSGDYDNVYKYNGKELDESTGLYYYGARYYDPRTSIWLSVDPLKEKYPNFSPYVYTANNPVMLIDPDGREVWPPENGYEGQTWKDNDGDFVYKGGTWYMDNGKFMGFLCGDCRYASLGNVNPTPGYDGKTMLPSSNYDYNYEVMPGKEADDLNYWKNGEDGTMASRIFETIGRDAVAKDNEKTTVEVTTTVLLTPRGGGGRMSNKLKPNPEAVGSHTTFKRNNNGDIYKYETYEKTESGHFNPTKRYDGGQPNGSPGSPHVNKQTGEDIPTPHVQGKKIQGGVRPAKEWEIPKQNKK
jgi:RHS repeat-associated protein